ncbi:cytochrome c [bacterium]|nr:cytochrome c [bacterium]
MKSLFLGILMMSFVLVRFAAAAEPDGKALFLANKCNTCHAIKSDGIEKTSKAKLKKEPPDLSTIGDQKTADWIVKYLKKQETLNNEKHVKAWAGKDEDLMAIAKWLEGHKTAK